MLVNVAQVNKTHRVASMKTASRILGFCFIAKLPQNVCAGRNNVFERE
jgi:hypothetical protein